VKRRISGHGQLLGVGPFEGYARARLSAIVKSLSRCWRQADCEWKPDRFVRILAFDMSTIDEILDIVRQRQQAGQFSQSEQLLREAVETYPDCPDFHLQLGDVLRLQDKLAEAVESLQHGIRLRPESALAHVSLGKTFARLNRAEAAVDCFRHALRLDARNVEALSGLAIALAESGRTNEAVDLFRRVLEVQPESSSAHHNLGVCLAQSNRHDEAIARFEHALRLDPDYLECEFNLANTLSDMARYEAAVSHFEKVLARRPDHVDALINYGNALTELARPRESAVYLRHATRLNPNQPMAFNNLGLALADMGRFAEAESAYEQSLTINPRQSDVLTNLGSVLKEQGRLKEAIACYQLALWFEPDAATTHWNRALAWLQMGDYERGWPEYEWRWKRKRAPKRAFREPLWDGSSLEGRTILLTAEQGLGDMLQFIRYAPMVKERGGTVVLACPAIMLPILSRCKGIDRFVSEGQPFPPFNVQAPLMSLPSIFKTTLPSVPACVPYVFCDPALVDRWRRELSRWHAFKVGIAWQGNPYHRWDHHRSTGLAPFAVLARVEGVQYFSLQRVHGLGELDSNVTRLPVETFGADFDVADGAFMDTMAVMSQLDLVITPDTALAHLAGALGVPVWVPLSAIADWRWMVDREDSPWYPTMRLFRQTELGNWPAVFEKIATELERFSKQPMAVK
jgi:tetratricopeptide (TPR) repeat protein